LFQKYVPSQILETVSPGGNLSLGGQLKDLTCAFLDIRDFTRMSASMSPQATIGLLNELFTLVQRVVSEQRGWIDKFLGDGVLMTWGALENQNSEPVLAVQTALQILAELDELNQHLRDQGLPDLRIGIGIHFGNAVVGNVGTQDRMEFTSIGATLNLAARLQELCKLFSSPVVISERVYAGLPPALQKRFSVPTEMKVRGFNEPVRICQLITSAEISKGEAAVAAR
jgi:adenylate cyclase